MTTDEKQQNGISNHLGDKSASVRGSGISVKGIILPAELDWNFNTTSIMVSTDQEEEYLLARGAKERELFDHIRESVRVTGTVMDKGEGQKIIDVTDYEVIDY